ncbi:MAG: ion transporter [Sandaracinaceae bacterium]|nr:ion transporter [Sandaracinaceae bacterium]
MGQRLQPLHTDPLMPRWWDRLVLVSTVIALVLILVDMQLDHDSAEGHLLGYIDFGFCALFAADFGYRFYRARPYRWRFFRRNWVDLLGCIPVVGPLRAARLVRLVRLIRLARVLALTRRVLRGRELPFRTDAMANLTCVALGVWLLAASAFYHFEDGHNPSIHDPGDALWWSMTTLSTVGYGDLYPYTLGGRVVAVMTMILGVGVLGTLAATIAAGLIEYRERGQKGLRTYMLKHHLLVLGWNEKSFGAIDDFRHDPRYLEMPICVVADLETTPIAEPVLFVRGRPGSRDSLSRSSAEFAAAAIVFANDPNNPQSDHETALIALALKKLNPKVRLSAELIDPENREHLEAAGCDAVIDTRGLASTLLVRSVQDLGVGDLLQDLLTNKYGSEIYRVPVDEEFIGKTFLDFNIAMLGLRRTVLSLVRDGDRFLINPRADEPMLEGDEAFVISEEPPT